MCYSGQWKKKPISASQQPLIQLGVCDRTIQNHCYPQMRLEIAETTSNAFVLKLCWIRPRTRTFRCSHITSMQKRAEHSRLHRRMKSLPSMSTMQIG